MPGMVDGQKNTNYKCGQNECFLPFNQAQFERFESMFQWSTFSPISSYLEPKQGLALMGMFDLMTAHTDYAWVQARDEIIKILENGKS